MTGSAFATAVAATRPESLPTIDGVDLLLQTLAGLVERHYSVQDPRKALGENIIPAACLISDQPGCATIMFMPYADEMASAAGAVDTDDFDPDLYDGLRKFFDELEEIEMDGIRLREDSQKCFCIDTYDPFDVVALLRSFVETRPAIAQSMHKGMGFGLPALARIEALLQSDLDALEAESNLKRPRRAREARGPAA